MKTIISLLILTLLIVAIVFGARLAPYHFFKEAFESGITSEFLNMKRVEEIYRSGSVYEAKKMEGVSTEQVDNWRDFHIENYIVPLPKFHPLMHFVPLFQEENFGLSVGGQFVSSKGVLLNSFRFKGSAKFIPNVSDDKIFHLPIFFKRLVKKDPQAVWEDLFSLRADLLKSVSILDSREIENISYYDLVYALYIVKLRKKFFGKYIKSLGERKIQFSYDFDNNRGVIEYEADDNLVQEFYTYKKGLISIFEISSKKDNITAEFSRRRLVDNIRAQETNKESAITTYASYKRLSYSDRASDLGMTYLFSAWTHDQGNKNYFRQMIFFLERGKSNMDYLAPLYEYAFKKFGTNFSSYSSRIKEDSKIKLKRKVNEELKAEIRREEMEPEQLDREKFEDKNSKVDFLIKRAKDLKVNLDESEDTLISD